MKAVFVTGTDTGAGKTVVSGLLARFLNNKGYRAITQKWIQTGSGEFPEDIGEHLKLMKKNKEKVKEYMPFISPYNFKLAASPHLCARLEKKTISAEKIKRSFKLLSEKFDFVIVEGIGGALVPFSKNGLVIDIAEKLSLPVLIVAVNKIGAINHTLLTIEAIRKRKMKIAGIIFNSRENDLISEDNPKIIRKLTGEKVLGALPWIENKDLLYKRFAAIGKRWLKNG